MPRWLHASAGLLFFVAGWTSAASMGTPLETGPSPAGMDARSAAALYHLAFSTQPASVQTLVVVTPPVAVSIRDFFGDAVPQANVDVSLTLTRGDGTLLGTTRRPTDAYGVATFDDLAFSTPGAKQLTAAATGYDPAVSDSVIVQAASAIHISVVTQPSSSAVAGVRFARQPVVRLQDSLGHVRTGDNATIITASASTGEGTLLGTTSLKVKKGVAQFTDLALKKAGNVTLAFSAPAVQSAASAPVLVAAAAASALAFTSQPSTAVVRTTLPALTVQLLDGFGNSVPVSGTSVTMSLASGTGTLLGTTRRTTGSAGAAAFDDLSFDAPGDKTLTASSSGLQAASTSTITVAAGTPARLAFLVQPSSSRAGTEISPAPQVQVQDSQGNPTTADALMVNLALNGEGTMQGTTSRGTTGGTVTFTGLVITRTGQMTITASASGMTSVRSAAFSITPGAAAAITATAGTQQSTVVRSQFPTRLTVSVRDGFGNGIGGLTVTFSLPALGASASFGGGASTAVTDSTGEAVAGPLTANNVAGSYSVTASVPGVSTPASFALQNTAAGVSVLTPTAGTPQSAAVGNVFPARLQVTAKDAGGNSLSGVMIRFRTPASGASATFSGSNTDSVLSDAQGTAASRLLTANTVTGRYDVVASADGGASATFAMTNTAGPLARMTVDAAPSGGTIDTQMVNRPFAIRLRAVDEFDNVVTSFSGQAVVSSDGILSVGGGETGPFQQGVLPSYTVAFSQAGSFVLVATRSGGTEGGTSNLFVVAIPAPTFTAITPSSFHPGDSALVTIDGTGFLPGVTTASLGSGIVLSGFSVISPTRFTARLAAGTDAAPGTRDLSITNPGPGGGTVVAKGIVQVAGNPVPTIASVDPSICFQGQHLTLTVQGTGFASGLTTAQFTGTGLQIDTTTVDASTRLKLTVTVQPDAPVGGRDLVVSNRSPGGGSVTRTSALVVNSILAAVAMPISPPDGAQNIPATVAFLWQEVPGITRDDLSGVARSDVLGRGHGLRFGHSRP